jgi:hypothetical protein
MIQIKLKFSSVKINLETLQQKSVAFRELNKYFNDTIIVLNFIPQKGNLIDINKFCKNEFSFIDILQISEILIEDTEFMTLILSSPSDYMKIKDTY